ncbi:MAG: hypothetical protein ACI3YM_01305 [Prevotella sp.]
MCFYFVRPPVLGKNRGNYRKRLAIWIKDAYAGLLDILGLSGTVSISKVHLQGATALPTADGNMRITFATPTDGPIDCRLYSTGGSLLKSVTIPTSTSTYDVNLDHHQGIVAVQVGKLGSTLVRL